MSEQLRAALAELRNMHERAHELTWDECEVCDIIRAALAATPEPGIDARSFTRWFLSQPITLQGSFVREWLTKHPEYARLASKDRAEVSEMTRGPA